MTPYIGDLREIDTLKMLNENVHSFMDYMDYSTRIIPNVIELNLVRIGLENYGDFRQLVVS